MSKDVVYKKRVGIFVFKMPQNLEQIYLFYSIHNEDNNNDKGVLGIMMSCNQKQPSRGIFMKKCSENMQQVYRTAPIPKCDFNNVTLQLY